MKITLTATVELSSGEVLTESLTVEPEGTDKEIAERHGLLEFYILVGPPQRLCSELLPVVREALKR